MGMGLLELKRAGLGGSDSGEAVAKVKGHVDMDQFGKKTRSYHGRVGKVEKIIMMIIKFNLKQRLPTRNNIIILTIITQASP